MRHIVGVADMKFSKNDADEIVTFALGSCIGLALYDPRSGVGGILHYMLPLAEADPVKAQKNPYMFGDTGIPAFFQELYNLGAVKDRMRVALVGGAGTRQNSDLFQIGLRNIQIAYALFYKNKVDIHAEHVGGNIPRSLFLSMKSGQVWIESQGQILELL